MIANNKKTFMKKHFIVVTFLVLLTLGLSAQQKDYRVVFDMSTRDSVSQQALIRELELIRKENPVLFNHWREGYW